MKKFQSVAVSLARLFLLLAVFQLWVYSYAIAKSCPAGVPVGTFKLLVLPAKGGAALRLEAMNIVEPGEKLRYEPVKLPEDLKEKARVSVIIVSATDNGEKHLEVLSSQPLNAPAEWLFGNARRRLA